MATLGSPNIATPRPEDWRAWQTAISNARQRIEVLEAQLGIVQTTAQQTSSTSTSNLNSILAQLSNLTKRVIALEQATATDIGQFVAGETLIFGQGVVPLTSGTVGAVDPSDPRRIFGLIGIALNSATAGTPVSVQRRGVLTLPGVTGLVAGRAVYVDGVSVTQTPDYDATAIPLGVAVSTTQIFIAPDWPALLYPTFSSGFVDHYLDYLPVTFRALKDGSSLEAMIDSLPFSSGVDSHAQVPMTVNGVAVRVNAGDIGGGSTPANLQALIDALAYNSGVDAHMQIPVTIGGIAVRINAGDVANLTNLAALFASLPFSSGAEAYGLVPMEIGGVVTLVYAADIARLGRKPFWRGAAWDGGGLAIVATSATIVRCLPVPANGTIVEAFAEGNGGPGSLQAEVWYTDYAGAPATSANKISGASPITITAGYKSSDTTLAGWSPAVSEGGILVFKLNSCSFTAATVGVRMVPT